MKSILQEASTIAKAVEQGWKEAGEPAEFSVKILELPQRNFIGLTTRSAKIAFMFHGSFQKTQETSQKTQTTTAPKPYTPREKREFTPSPAPQRQPQPSSYEKAPAEKPSVQSSVLTTQKPVSQVKKSPFEAQKPVREVESKADAFGADSEVRKRPEGLWNEDIALFSRDWLEKVFIYMDRPDITFTIESQSFYLRITLSSPVFTDEGQEKHLLASLSSLMFATIKKHFRKALRGHKIVLTHAARNER